MVTVPILSRVFICCLIFFSLGSTGCQFSRKTEPKLIPGFDHTYAIETSSGIPLERGLLLLTYEYKHGVEGGVGTDSYQICNGLVHVPAKTDLRTSHLVSMIPPPIFTDIAENPYQTRIYVISDGYYPDGLYNSPGLIVKEGSMDKSTTIFVRRYSKKEETENLELILRDASILGEPVREFASRRYKELAGHNYTPRTLSH